MSDYDQMVAMLRKAGYEESDEDPVDMGHMEFVAAAKANKRIISVGPGRSGDESCYTNFYFTLGTGAFLEHASNCDE